MKAATSTTPLVGGTPADSVFLTPWIGIAPGATSVFASFSNILANHTYVLDVAGIASGTSGGTYFGQMNLVSTPLPAAAWLLISAVLGLGMLPRRWRVRALTCVVAGLTPIPGTAPCHPRR